MEVFEEVQPHVITLMQDVFGNYVIQKCFEHGTKVRGCSLRCKQAVHVQAVGPVQNGMIMMVEMCQHAVARLLPAVALCSSLQHSKR